MDLPTMTVSPWLNPLRQMLPSLRVSKTCGLTAAAVVLQDKIGIPCEVVYNSRNGPVCRLLLPNTESCVVGSVLYP